MAKPVEIGSRSFRTQSSALEHYKAVLNRYEDGQRIADQGDHSLTSWHSSSCSTQCSTRSVN